MEIWSNKDNAACQKEHNSFPRLPQCKTCMRLVRPQHVTHACTCESVPELDNADDVDGLDPQDPNGLGVHDVNILLEGDRPADNVVAVDAAEERGARRARIAAQAGVPLGFSFCCCRVCLHHSILII